MKKMWLLEMYVMGTTSGIPEGGFNPHPTPKKSEVLTKLSRIPVPWKIHP
jgi:hypothetical protein